jgi:mono/diheme cytochrome c family protein
VDAQVARGARVFEENCARCHGAEGQGTEKAPLLVGPGALPVDPRPDQDRAVRFRSAAEVARFAMHNMPPDPELRARIEEEDYWAVVAFALSANGIELEQPLGERNAGTIALGR